SWKPPFQTMTGPPEFHQPFASAFKLTATQSASTSSGSSAASAAFTLFRFTTPRRVPLGLQGGSQRPSNNVSQSRFSSGLSMHASAEASFRPQTLMNLRYLRYGSPIAL